MKRFFTIAILYILYLSSHIYVLAQELPPILNFTPTVYNAENQNWMLSQAPNKFIYAANNEGLLEFNGAEWTLYPSPNNTVLRAVKAIENRIYTGCYMEFGFWEKNAFGTLEYQTLTSTFNAPMIEDEHVWNIITYDEWILFQTFERIYFYNPKTQDTSIINSEHGISRVFNVDDVIYYHVDNEGLYKIEAGAPQLILSQKTLGADKIINLFATKNGLLIQTRALGFFTLHHNELNTWDVPVNDTLKNMHVLSSLQLRDKSFVIGTIKNGLLYVSPEGEIQYNINRNNGLANNTVLNLFEDADHNIWAGLDIGINCINIKSPIRVFNDDEGRIGTVYTALVYQDYLYLGTNQGLFYKKNKSAESFKFITGTSGQVWNLFTHDDTLFCGHHKGTFVINKAQAILVSNTPGTWGFKAISHRKNLLLEGNYNGLNVLEKQGDQWHFRNKIEGFDNSARFFECKDNRTIWVSHGYKGIFKLSINTDFTEATAVVLDTTLQTDKNSSLIRFKNKILYADKAGVFGYDSITNTFKKNLELSPIVTQSEYISGKLVVDDTEKLWGFSKDNMSYVDINHLTNTLKINQIAIPYYLRKGQIGYENIAHTSEQNYLIGITDGYLSLDLSKINYEHKHLIRLNAITLLPLDNTDIAVDLKEDGNFDYVNNSISFKYSVPNFSSYNKVQYQYKLEGRSNTWSEWSSKTTLTFDNLAFGDYNLQLRAKVGNTPSQNTIHYNFTIKRPWFLSNLAIGCYIILVFLLAYCIHKSYKKYFKRLHEHKELENERLITSMKNEKLNQKIESKNRELAISTMSLIKKNEVLNGIKKELKKELKKKKLVEESKSIKLINDNLNDSKDWSFFEQAFNNADKDFLEKIKKVHPDLTPNDLRFCAYLRLNLSSKEMAPLLNISLRSVETKRYRLRKKLGLDQDSSLVNYILNF